MHKFLAFGKKTIRQGLVFFGQANHTTALLLSLLLCVGGGWLSGLVTRSGVEGWYRHLVHPPGTPPDFVFPLVWTLLYTLMAVALSLVWSSSAINKKRALAWFMIQLSLNFSWSWLFFVMQNPFIALVDLLLMWGATFVTLLAFKSISRASFYLMLPYFIWISYAIYLNFFIWIYA